MFGSVEATRLSASNQSNAAWPSVRSEFSRKRSLSIFLIPLSSQLRERLPERVVVNLFHPDVVQLEKIDMIGLQPFQRRVRRPIDCFRRKILRDFALTATPRFAMVDEIVTNFCCDCDLVTLFRKRF